MSPPRVSVIVPAYNVEPYLAQCLDSLILQDLADLEIIVVNDGSTDEGGQIAMRYAESHPHVRVINQDNRGLSEARNAGMRVARGEFLGFVDGDDWVHPAMYLQMLRTAEASGAELVVTNGLLYNDSTRQLSPIQDHAIWTALRDSSGALDPRQHTELFRLDTSACKRLYRRSLLDRLEFQFVPGKIFEDVPTHYRLMLNTSAVVLLDQPFYYYRTNRPGRITARSDETLFHVFDVLEEVIRDLATHHVDFEIWANFIWFQGWVLRWLRKQIDERRADEFDRCCMAMAQVFSPAALVRFRDKFAYDAPACEFVGLQIAGGLTATSPARARVYQPDQETSHLGNDPIGFFNRDPFTFMPDIWGWVAIQYNVRSVLDIGCGIATNLAWFDEYGFDVLGVEGHPRAISGTLLPDRVVQHDFTKGPWAPERKFDLCLCTEFAEHVEAQFEENWMAAVDRCSMLLLAAAPPGQGEWNHVNEQPDEYWIARFAARGFELLAAESYMLRATCARLPSKWGRNAVLLFRRGTASLAQPTGEAR